MTSEQLGLFGDDGELSAHARRTDPQTSHDAARSLPSEKIRKSQEAVLRFMRESGPMTDETLVDDYPIWARRGDRPKQSSSGLRTRRNELVRRKLVVDTGRTEVLSSGRKAIVWAPVDKAGEVMTVGTR